MNTTYMLKSTNDHTDRTAEIEAQLKEKGYCMLDSGVFYVSGVNMPANSTLMGINGATRVILAPEKEEGYAIKLDSFCTVRDLTVDGSLDEIPHPDAVGARHGLLFQSNATTKQWGLEPRNSTVSNCVIRYFSGGGITCTDTGYYLNCILAVSNCHILNCGAGVNISHFSEYHDFSNVICTENLYGCINNGGNNTFSSCSFSGNEIGFMIDNRDNKSPNNSHGTVTGCSFNHCGDNKGIAILLYGANCGHVFMGCQVFFGKIIIKDSISIVFDALNFGRQTSIDVEGGGLVMFSNCAFREAQDTTVSITQNDAVKFVNCYTREGKPFAQ
ncbi:MAG: hypothetical protein E7639_03330 [Ruminococcaceae bacterium]|nr:hypothetical protein [Oscillospiraceae bacterium]